MGAENIIAKANEIIVQAEALEFDWPISVNCLDGTIPTSTAFTSWDNWTDSKTRHSRLQADVEPGNVFFIGTSITASMNVTRIHPAALNFGIGGDTMRGVLNRLASLTGLLQAGAVVLEIGANDAGYESYENIDILLDRIYGWFTGPIVVLSLIPQGNGALSVATLDAVNDLMATKLSGRPSCVLVDVTTPLQDTDGLMKNSLSIGDRIHPNGAGYAVIRPLVQSALNSLL